MNSQKMPQPYGLNNQQLQGLNNYNINQITTYSPKPSHTSPSQEQNLNNNTQDSPQGQELANKIMEIFSKASQKKFTFLLIGRSGIGKSSTINSLMGRDIAPVGDDEPTTFTVQYFESEAFGIPFRVIDTPGLCDDLEENGNDEKYINTIQDQIEQLDCVWFVSPLNDTRVRSDEKRAIKLIHQAFGSEIWEHAIIVFTFADLVQPDQFAAKLSKRTDLIREEIAKYAGKQVADQVPSVAISNKSKNTPDGKSWLGQLYKTVINRIDQKGLISFYLATAPRLKTDDSTNQSAVNTTSGEGDYSSPIYLDAEQEESIQNKILNFLATTLQITTKTLEIVDGMQKILSIVSPAVKTAVPVISKASGEAAAAIVKNAPKIAETVVKSVEFITKFASKLKI